MMKLIHNKKIWIGIGLSPFVLVAFIFLLSFVIPIPVPKDVLNQFSYKVYPSHVELTKYLGHKKNVKVPKYLWGRPVTVIGYQCFHVNNSIQSVRLTDKVEEIQEYAFANCFWLQEVTGGTNVIKIKQYAFYMCENLGKAEVYDSVVEIEIGAFRGCKALKEFPILDSLESIGGYAFISTEIGSLEEKENVKVIGWNPFLGTPWYEAQTGDYIFYKDILIGYQGEEEVIRIPEGTRGIAMSFLKDDKVKEIYLPPTVEYMVSSAFGNLEDVRVYIPDIDMKNDYGKTEYSIGSKEEITIVTVSGSPAEAYAKEMGYAYELVEPWW